MSKIYETAYPEDDVPIVTEYDQSYVSIDPIKQYLNEIGRTPLLNAEQEVDLFTRVEAGLYATHLLSNEDNIPAKYFGQLGDLEAVKKDGEACKERIFKANLRLVVSLAKRKTGRGVDMLDLIQDGNFGLDHAIEKFDYTKGYKFSTYATWWIKQAIARSVHDSGTTIRIPVNKGIEIDKMQHAERQLLQSLGVKPTLLQLATEMGMAVETVKDLKEHENKTVSLEKLIGEDATLADFIPDTKTPSPTEQVLSRELKDSVEDLVGMLDERQATVIRMKYGLDGSRPKTNKEIAAKLGVTGEAIRQAEARSMNQLRKYGNITGIRELLTG